MVKANTKTITALGATLVLVITANCAEEPADPGYPNWYKQATVPTGIELTGGICPGIYVTGVYDNSGPACILRYTAGAWEEVYTSPSEGYYYLADVKRDLHHSSPWAGGRRYGGGLERPLLLHENYTTKEWDVLDVNGYDGYAISRVFPLNEWQCWFLLDDYHLPGDGDGIVALYDRGTLKTFPALGGVTCALSNNGALFAVQTAPPAPSEGVAVYITQDLGASWRTETIPNSVVGGRTITAARATSAKGAALNVIAELEGGRATAVLTRSGDFGNGDYTLAFLSYTGPYFYQLQEYVCMPPQTEPYGISYDAVGVGDMTTIAVKNGFPLVEVLPYPINFFRAIASSSTGFYAVGYEYATKQYGLYYHP